MKHIPNALTLLRLVLAPVVAWLMWSRYASPGAPDLSGVQWRLSEIANTMTLAAVLFIVAALTDLFDGMIARAFNAHSKFGRIIDPIADKALVGLPLLVIAIASVGGLPGTESLIIVMSTAVIIVRDISITIIRFTSSDGEGVRVSSLAKWKTALELLTVGAYLVGYAVLLQVIAAGQAGGWDAWAPAAAYGWIALLAVTAALSAWTGWQYLRPAKPAP